MKLNNDWVAFAAYILYKTVASLLLYFCIPLIKDTHIRDSNAVYYGGIVLFCLGAFLLIAIGNNKSWLSVVKWNALVIGINIFISELLFHVELHRHQQSETELHGGIIAFYLIPCLVLELAMFNGLYLLWRYIKK